MTEHDTIKDYIPNLWCTMPMCMFQDIFCIEKNQFTTNPFVGWFSVSIFLLNQAFKIQFYKFNRIFLSLQIWTENGELDSNKTKFEKNLN
jgi:hypothetical protein